MRLTTAGWEHWVVKDRWREDRRADLSRRSNLAERAANFSSYFWPAEAAEAEGATNRGNGRPCPSGGLQTVQVTMPLRSLSLAARQWHPAPPSICLVHYCRL